MQELAAARQLSDELKSSAYHLADQSHQTLLLALRCVEEGGEEERKRKEKERESDRMRAVRDGKEEREEEKDEVKLRRLLSEGDEGTRRGREGEEGRPLRKSISESRERETEKGKESEKGKEEERKGGGESALSVAMACEFHYDFCFGIFSLEFLSLSFFLSSLSSYQNLFSFLSLFFSFQPFCSQIKGHVNELVSEASFLQNRSIEMIEKHVEVSLYRAEVKGYLFKFSNILSCTSFFGIC